MKKNTIQASITLLSMILLISPAVGSDCVWIPSDLYDESFETDILNLMEEGSIESCSFSVLKGTEVFYSKGFGDQPGTDVAYYILSSAKMFTATAFLLLYEQGLIDLDDNINDYLPYELKNPHYPTSIITIKHLLSHRSSISSAPPPPMWWEGLLNGSSSFPDSIYNYWHENGSYYSPDYWYEWPPGINYHYADIGFDVLALAFENITETTLIDYITTNILNPLGMVNTKHDFNDYEPEKLAIGYQWNQSSQVNEVFPHFNASLIPGAGGFYSTVEDMSIFMLTHLNQGEYNGIRILNETSIELMHTKAGSDYALGWQTEREIAGRDYQGHCGGPAVGFCSRIGIYNSICVVSLFNQGGAKVNPVDNHWYQNSIFDCIFDLALNIAIERPCETSFYILPAFTVLGLMVYFTMIRKKK